MEMAFEKVCIHIGWLHLNSLHLLLPLNCVMTISSANAKFHLKFATNWDNVIGITYITLWIALDWLVKIGWFWENLMCDVVHFWLRREPNRRGIGTYAFYPRTYSSKLTGTISCDECENWSIFSINTSKYMAINFVRFAQFKNVLVLMLASLRSI